MKYIFHTAGISGGDHFITDFEGMTFEAKDDDEAFDVVSDLATKEDELVLAEIDAGRLDRSAYDNLPVLLDYLWAINSDGTETNVGAVETGREEPCRRPYRPNLFALNLKA